MKKINKLLVVLSLALIACLAIPALLPAGQGNPYSALASASLNKTRATLYNGKTLRLKVTGTSKSVKWSSSNSLVATVDQKGLVTARKVGKAMITAQVDGRKLTCAVTVKSPVSASPSSLTMDVGETKTVTIQNKLGGSGLSLEKYDSSVLQCDLGRLAGGKCTLTVRALRPGNQTLVVRNAKTGDAVQIRVAVREGQAPEDPIVDRTRVTVTVGKTATVRVTWPYSGVPHMWYDDSGVVSCSFGEWSDDGWPLYIKGVGKGSATVWFTKSSDSSETPLATIRVTVK